MRAMGTILAGAALMALGACGGGTTPAVNNAVGNDLYVPDDLGNDLLLNESDLNAVDANAAADNGAATNSAGNSS